ncbi:MAG: aminotransferase class I/II-fold pyridoxal phosphate-dependent enzyme [Ruminococcaceae bacterium]|nr:aminotransferase class I/II-fold pyridoxal phosphate-dependent enzyme [Oscillospiraceae bacterium]
MKRHLPLATPHMSDEGYELEFVHDAFRKNWIAPLGENVNGLEAALAEYLGRGNTVALSAGTAALHLSLILSGVKAGDLVFCQDLTFCASANPVTYLGAEPVFIDSERDTWNMDPAALERAFTLYGKPKAVVVVHLYGTPAKMGEICAICQREGVTLIEDAAEALGSEYKSRKCGTFGRFGILSFNGNKIITTSGGGMLVCQDKADATHALKLATQAREPFPWYQHEEIGFNYRLSNICAGIGRGQAKVLPQRVEKKRAIYQRYAQQLAELPLSLQPMAADCRSNCWLSVLLLDKGCGVTPAQVLDALKADDIEGRPLWKPMHAQPVYANAKFVTAGDVSVAEDLFARGVCLPSDTKMTDEDVDRVCAAIKALF